MSTVKPLVVILDVIKDPYIEKQELSSIADVEAFYVHKTEEIPDRVKDADIVIAWHHCKICNEQLLRLKKAKAVIRAGVGFDNVDIKFAGERGLVVCNVPDYGTEEVADSALSLILGLMRKTNHLANLCSQGRYATLEAHGSKRLRGRTLGIIGFGRIGKAVAERGKAFGFKIGFYDPYINDGEDKALGVSRYDTLNELMSKSDVISVNCLLNNETYHLINTESLSQVKKGSFLVNTARGGIINEKALAEALNDGRLAGVGLDVLENEPTDVESKVQLNPDLINRPNVIITPHSAFYSDESFEELRRKTAIEAKRILLGQKSRNIVNKTLLPTSHPYYSLV